MPSEKTGAVGYPSQPSSHLQIEFWVLNAGTSPVGSTPPDWVLGQVLISNPVEWRWTHASKALASMASQEILRQEQCFSRAESMSLVHAHCSLTVLVIAHSRPGCSLKTYKNWVPKLYLHWEKRKARKKKEKERGYAIFSFYSPPASLSLTTDEE